MKTKTIIFCGMVFALSVCATTPQVFTDFDPQQDFSTYETFAWISADPITVVGDQGPNALTAQRLQANFPPQDKDGE